MINHVEMEITAVLLWEWHREFVNDTALTKIIMINHVEMEISSITVGVAQGVCE